MRVKRSKQERRDLASLTVKCWRDVHRVKNEQRKALGKRPNPIPDIISLRVRAADLVRHCLDKPVTADG